MDEKIRSLRKTARLAGVLYFILGLLGFYSIMYVPKQFFVREDSVATANNILENEFLFRTGIASHLISVTTFLVMVLVLYKLLRHVQEHLAKLMVALVAVQVPVIFLLETCKMISLRLLKEEGMHALELGQLQDLSMILIKFHGSGIMLVEIFWGLWLIPFGLLVYKSGFIPRALGVLLIIAGIGYTIDSLTYILFPDYRPFTMWPAFIFSGLGELSTILWFLIIGVKSKTQIVSL